MTNSQAIGYAILALKELGASRDFIERVEAEMKRQMSLKTEVDAEKAFMEN